MFNTAPRHASCIIQSRVALAEKLGDGLIDNKLQWEFSTGSNPRVLAPKACDLPSRKDMIVRYRGSLWVPWTMCGASETVTALKMPVGEEFSWKINIIWRYAYSGNLEK